MFGLVCHGDGNAVVTSAAQQMTGGWLVDSVPLFEEERELTYGQQRPGGWQKPLHRKWQPALPLVQPGTGFRIGPLDILADGWLNKSRRHQWRRD